MTLEACGGDITIDKAAPNPLESNIDFEIGCSLDTGNIQPVEISGDMVTITEVFSAPNPCYDVEGDVTMLEDEILIKLRLVNPPGNQFCIQCLATVIGKTSLHLPSGTHTLHIITPARDYHKSITVQ